MLAAKDCGAVAVDCQAVHIFPRACDGLVLVFSLDSPESFEEVGGIVLIS